MHREGIDVIHQWIRRWRERKNPLFAILSDVSLFRDLAFGELREVVRSVELLSYGAGDVVFEQGAPGKGVYVVLSGQVDIVQTDAESNEQVFLSRSAVGAFLGETALLDDAPRTAAAVAGTETELALFPREALLELAEQRPHLGVKIALQLSQVIAERLRRTNRGLRAVRDDLEAARHEGADAV